MKFQVIKETFVYERGCRNVIDLQRNSLRLVFPLAEMMENGNFLRRGRVLLIYHIKSATLNCWFVAQVFGSMVTPFLTDKYGRKIGYMIAVTVTVVATVVQFLSVRLGLPEGLIFGRSLTALSSPLGDASLLLYVQETSPIRIRGMASFFCEIGYGAMCVLGMVRLLKGDRRKALRSLEFFQGEKKDNERLLDDYEREKLQEENTTHSSLKVFLLLFSICSVTAHLAEWVKYASLASIVSYCVSFGGSWLTRSSWVSGSAILSGLSLLTGSARCSGVSWTSIGSRRSLRSRFTWLSWRSRRRRNSADLSWSSRLSRLSIISVSSWRSLRSRCSRCSRSSIWSRFTWLSSVTWRTFRPRVTRCSCRSSRTFEAEIFRARLSMVTGCIWSWRTGSSWTSVISWSSILSRISNCTLISRSCTWSRTVITSTLFTIFSWSSRFSIISILSRLTILSSISLRSWLSWSSSMSRVREDPVVQALQAVQVLQRERGACVFVLVVQQLLVVHQVQVPQELLWVQVDRVVQGVLPDHPEHTFLRSSLKFNNKGKTALFNLRFQVLQEVHLVP
uniref:MFS domain-containing protein n=1 Tax=Heterorhabditis bacteriophora TaxID=37862 RepID=A0A1I7XTQ9_HETBA